MFRSTTALVTTVAALTLQTAPVAAQNDGDSFSLETIMVTARNRSENIQKVPLAITAISAAELEKRSIQNLEDVARFTAGFSFETLDGGSGAPVIRGLTQIASFNREQTTAIFFDNIYLPRAFLFDASTENLGRIEIVKGPQSSRFGRNAFAGAINYIPKKANLNEMSAEGVATYGNHERFDIGGNANVIVVEDKLALYGAYNHSEFDGTWENTHPFADFGFSPGTEGNAHGYNNESYSVSAIFKPMDRLTIEGMYQGTQIRDEALATDYRNVEQSIGNCGPMGASGFRLFCGFFPDPNDTVAVEPRGFGRQVDSDIYRLEINFDVSDAIKATYLFGQIEASSLTAFQSEADPVTCGNVLAPFLFNDGSVVCNFQASPLGTLNYTSHEVRVAYDEGGPFTFALGGFMLGGTDNNFFVSASVPALSALDPQDIRPLNITTDNTASLIGGFPFNPVGFSNLVARNETTQTDVLAAFFEASYAFNDGRSRFSFEGRYTSEEIETRNNLTNMLVNNGAETFNFFTPRITAEHDLTDQNLVYATVARGAKAGGFNSAAFDTQSFGTYGPEFNWTYEVGSKNVMFDDRLVLNVAAFYTNWSNQQLTGLDPSEGIPVGTLRQGITLNIGSARVFGFEAEGRYQVTEEISLDGSFAYINSQFSDGAFDQASFVQTGVGEIEGNDLPRSPDMQVAFGAQYDGEINSDVTYFVRADGSYQSSQFAAPANNVKVKGRALFNARAGITWNEFSLDVWARNVLDKKYVSAANFIFQTPPSNNFLGAIYGERRTFGLTARVKY